MTVKQTLASGTGNSEFVRQTPRGSVQLSDGSLVAIDWIGGTWLLRRYTGDRTAVPVTLDTYNPGASDGFNEAASLCRDDLDNIYVVGGSPSVGTGALRVFHVIKGGTAQSPTWTRTRMTELARYQSTYANQMVIPYWVNTGTGGGRLIILSHLASWSVVSYNLVTLADKTGAAAVTENVTGAHSGSSNGSSAHYGCLDVRPDGFGSGTFLVTHPGDGDTSFKISRMTVPASGNIGFSAILATGDGGATNGYRGVQICRVGADRFIVIYGYQANRFYSMAMSTTAQIATALANTSVGQDQGMPLFGWTAYADPRLNGKAYAVARVTYTNEANGSRTHQVGKLAVTLSGTSLTWDTAATATADEQFNTPSPADRFRNLYSIRATHDVVGSIVDLQLTFDSSGYENPTNYLTVIGTASYNTVPNAAPITAPADGAVLDRASTIRIAATHNDPDGNVQAALRVRYRVFGTLGAWTVLSRSDAVGYIDVPPNTLAGQVEAQAATSDGEGFGAYGPSRVFRVDEAVVVPSTLISKVDPATVFGHVQTQRALNPAV